MTHTVHPLKMDGASYASCLVEMKNTELNEEAYRAVFMKGFQGWALVEVRVRRDGKRGPQWATMNGRFQERRICDLIKEAGQWPA